MAPLTAAGPGETKTVFAGSSPVTGVAPSAGEGGQPIGSLDGATVVVKAVAGTLAGGGSLECYLYDTALAAPARIPDYDLALSSAVNGKTQQAFQVRVRADRPGQALAWVPVGVTLNGGGTTGVEVSQLGYAPSSRRGVS